MTTHRELVIGLAAKDNIPAIYGFGYYARDGGLVSYGFDVRDLFMRAASYVDRILRGIHPADLPVQVLTKFELVITHIEPSEQFNCWSQGVTAKSGKG